MLIDYYPIAKKIIFGLRKIKLDKLFGVDEVGAHEKAISYMRRVQISDKKLRKVADKHRFESERIKITINGKEYKNPLGLAAGFDKNALVTQFIQALNFGWEEVGSITNLECDGNSGPVLKTYPKEKRICNRMGLNNEGISKIIDSSRLQVNSSSSAIPQWINFTKSNYPDIMGNKAIDDMAQCYYRLCDYGLVHVLNVSCPNSKDGKTFEDPDVFRDLLTEIEKYKPEGKQLFVKFSPQAESVGLTKIALEHGATGIIQGNTKPIEDPVLGRCGESGAPLYENTLKQVQTLYSTFKDEIPIIACGGISNGKHAEMAIRSGATGVELLTSLIYEGPKVAMNICKHLDSVVEREGLDNISEIRGSEVYSK